MRWGRVAVVVGKEARELWRDRITVAVCLLMPLVMLFLFGYAINLDVEAVPLAVVDQDRTPQSRALIGRFVQSDYFRYARDLSSVREAEAALLRSRAKVALVIPRGFQKDLVKGMDPGVQVLVDGTYSATALLVAAYANAIVVRFPTPEIERVRAEYRIWYNPAMRSMNYVVPGLYGVILMAFPPLLTALAIVREKESGSIQQIFASPLTSREFVAGKLIPYAMVAYLQILMVIALGYFWFAVPFRGEPWLLMASSAVYVMTTVGIGLLVSAVTRTQLAAMLLALIVTLMPSFLFSGFLFPIFTMPLALQLYSKLFPAGPFMEISRGVVLKGADLESLWPNLLLLVLYTLVVFIIAAARLKKKVA
ncbi:MAG: ABC transporter permease [Gammaproteobacteria bacterium]|nr:ABC transporter permease [Gammaproteobacteria bacterium]